MTRLLYDSITATDIPVTAQMVGGYVSGSFRWTDADWGRFPGAVHVRIATAATVTGAGVHVLDVEAGDATPGEAPGWARAQRALGQPPTIYCSTSQWPVIRAAFASAGEPEPAWWVAAYPGGGAVIPAGAVAHQYADPATSGGHWDLSVVADYWPGVDNAGGTPVMELNSGYKDWAGNPQTVQGTLDHLDSKLTALFNAFFAPTQKSRIPGDKNSTDLNDALLDTVARVTELQSAIGKPTPVTVTVDAAALQAALSAALASTPVQSGPSADQIAAAVMARLSAATITGKVA